MTVGDLHLDVLFLQTRKIDFRDEPVVLFEHIDPGNPGRSLEYGLGVERRPAERRPCLEGSIELRCHHLPASSQSESGFAMAFMIDLALHSAAILDE
jgi:hypothetical protein